MPVLKATDIFKEPTFTSDELVRILAAGAGRTVYFATGKQNADPVVILAMYARGRSPADFEYKKEDDPAEFEPVTRGRVYQMLRAERAELKADARGRYQLWLDRGLTQGQICRLFKRERGTISEALNGRKPKGKDGSDGEEAETGRDAGLG